MKEQVELAAKLYKCNDTAKKFFKEEYPAKIEKYIMLLKGYCHKENVDTLEAVLKLSNDEIFQDNGMALMMLMSAAVDIIEA